MRVFWRGLWLAAVALAVQASCGGQSKTDPSGGGAGGSSTGGTSTGGTSSGGTGACGPMPGGSDCFDQCSGMYSLSCIQGTWSCVPPQPCGGSGGTGGTIATGGTGACGPMPGGVDCFDSCSGQMYSPSCVNGSWDCIPKPCPDAGGPDAAACPTGQVPTLEGCLTCTDAAAHLSAEIEKARKANAACSTAADCVMTGDSTACFGSCGVAVSKSGEAAFQTALSYWDGAYCSGYVAVCGYSTPSCAQPTLVCNAGSCDATY
jgi:hypothetical protein